MKFALTKKSGNKKTGSMALITACRSTCPSDCPFRGEECYGEGFRTKPNWNKVDSGDRGGNFEELLSSIGKLPSRSKVRYGDIGDLPSTGDSIDRSKAMALAEKLASRGRTAYAYTHHNPDKFDNATTIKTVNDGTRMTINLSAIGWKQSDDLASRAIAPVVTVLPHDMPENWRVDYTPEGRKIVRCPAEYIEGFTFNESCGAGNPLCARKIRSYIVGFTAHGNRKRSIKNKIAAMEDRY